MGALTRSFAIIAVVLGFAGLAVADSLEQHLFIQYDGTTCPPPGCQQAAWFGNDWWYTTHFNGKGPYQTSGGANFNPIAPPWAYSYASDYPSSWLGQCGQTPGICTYDATYTVGGEITINGPDGLVFTGVLTGGTYEGFYQVDIYGYRWSTAHESATFDFYGTWSNGVEGYGTISEYSSFYNDAYHQKWSYHNEARLDIYTPEPGTLISLGSAALLLMKISRRRGF